MITDISENYTFRKVDLSIFPDIITSDISVDSRIGTQPKISTGHSKAAQNFLKALMTPLGHFRSDPTYGSEFSLLIRSGGLIYPDQITSIFAIEALRVVEVVFGKKGAAYPDDEVIVGATLRFYQVDRTSITLEILLIYRNSDLPKEFIIPINLGTT